MAARGTGRAKRPGKTQWAGRRRPSTRQAGFSVHPDATGGEMRKTEVGGWKVSGPGRLTVRFDVPATDPGMRLGWGLWFYVSRGVGVRVDGFESRHTLETFTAPNWGKAGSQWISNGEPCAFEFVVEAEQDEWQVALYDIHAGAIDHAYYRTPQSDPEAAQHARLMTNMWEFAPEANFVAADVHVEVSEPELQGAVEPIADLAQIVLKSCNRCARFLPINTDNEREWLSFSNHCVAHHPCKHGTFGRLRDVDSGEVLQLEYGFQLECRFCKKFEVNAAHNGQRTASQRKEDGARRRAIELLLTELYQGSPSLLHRKRFAGRELAESVWKRFEGRCFKCGTQLARERDMHLDHTRPLALLWPLDETATCLCATHNSAKRDRPPAEFYDDDELGRLAALTGLSLDELRDPAPNLEAIELLAERLDWFFGEFLLRDELQTERDGKLPADLLVKALQKSIDLAPGPRLDLEGEYRRRSAA